MEMSHFDLIFSCEKKPAFNPTKSNDWFFGVKCFFRTATPCLKLDQLLQKGLFE